MGLGSVTLLNKGEFESVGKMIKLIKPLKMCTDVR